MIATSRSSLAIYSLSMTSSDITAALGISPSRTHERGELVSPRIPSKTRSHSVWTLDADPTKVDPADMTGFGSMRVLIEALRGREKALAALRTECEMRIWWSGDSDSGQGGFVLPADLLSDLAALGCDLFGTAHFEEPELHDKPAP